MHPEKWLGPHRICGSRWWDETIARERMPGPYTLPPRSRGKNGKCTTATCRGRNPLDFLLGCCPTFAPWANPAAGETKARPFAQAQWLHPYPPCRYKGRLSATEDTCSQKAEHPWRCLFSSSEPFQPPPPALPATFEHQGTSWGNTRTCTSIALFVA